MKRQSLQETTFFRLTPSVRDRLLEINLTAAEWRIWCYLVSLDPFGDRGAKFIPAELMLKCKIKKTTYFSAKAKFQKLGLFDFRDGVTKVVNLQTSLISTASAHSQQAKIIESEISESEFGISDNHSEISESEFGISDNHSEISESEFGISDNRSLKPIPCKASKTPQTLQTYLDFKRSLSEDERENFFNFVKEETKNLERKINDLEAWLASKNAAKQNRWEIYYKNYQEEKINQKPRCNKQNQDSASLTAARNRAIAKFQKQMNINQPVSDCPPEDINNPEYRQKLAKVNELLAIPPKQEKSRAQQYREKIAYDQQQQQEINCAREEAASERAKQQNPDLEQRRLEMLRQIEKMKQLQQNSHPEDNR